MISRVPGLNQQTKSRSQIPDGVVLVSVHRVLYINGQKPYFAVSFKVLQPQAYAGQHISTRLYCTERALWKLHWFLKEFNYDPKLLDQDEIDEKAVSGPARGRQDLPRQRQWPHLYQSGCVCAGKC